MIRSINLKFPFVLFLGVALCAGCTTKQVLKDASASSEADGQGVVLAAKWIKRKPKKTDALVIVRNKYKFDIVISEDAFRLTCNSEEGVSRKVNPRWILKTGDSKLQTVSFTFDDNIEGTCLLKLENIFRGDSTAMSVTDAKGSTIGGAVGSAHGHTAGALGMSKSQSQVKQYVGKTSVEGERLPSVELKFDAE